MSLRCATFARSRLAAGRGREPRVEDLRELSLARQAQRQREHVGVVPAPRALGGGRVGAQRGADAGDLVRRDRRARARPAADDGLVGAALGDVAGRGLARTRPSRRARRRPARREAAPRGRARAARSTSASATPVSSSAATAMRMRPRFALGRYRRRGGRGADRARGPGRRPRTSPPPPAGFARTAARARRPRDGVRLPGRGAARRAVSLRRRRARLPLARRPRAPPDGVPRRRRRSARRRSTSRCGWAHTRAGRAALGAAAATGVKRMAHRFIVGETPHDARGVLRGALERRRRLVRRPARRGDDHRGRGRPLRGALRGRARRARRRVRAARPASAARAPTRAGRRRA